MASQLETFSEDEIRAINEAVAQTNTKKAIFFLTQLACRCLLVGRKLFHPEFATKS